MEKMTPKEVREEFLSRIEQTPSPTIDWVTYEKSDRGDNWGLYVQVARQLARDGEIELGHDCSTFFKVRRSS